MDAKLGLYNLYRIGKGALGSLPGVVERFRPPAFSGSPGKQDWRKTGVDEGKPATNKAPRSAGLWVPVCRRLTLSSTV
jgi:hypothetical protein